MTDYPDDFEDVENDLYIKHGEARPRLDHRPRRSLAHAEMKAQVVEQNPSARKSRKPKPSPVEAFHQLAEEDTGAAVGFQPSFAAITSKNHLSNHEREWILTYLGVFYQDHLISDVLRRVKGGKEATVYCCRAEPGTGSNLVAGKVYHEREHRKLKNDALYRQGRAVLDDQGKGVRGRREALAMKKKTAFGHELRHTSWLSSEFGTMQTLYKAGADVPRPIAQSDNAILMEYVGDEKWAAPTLSQVALQPEEAQPLFDRLMRNVELMLSHDLVHGDLSAHNILYWEGEVKIIDFPQAVNPFINPDAFALFARDVQRLCQYFARYGVAADARALSAELWERYMPA